jgi:hypothetical protein
MATIFSNAPVEILLAQWKAVDVWKLVKSRWILGIKFGALPLPLMVIEASRRHLGINLLELLQ